MAPEGGYLTHHISCIRGAHNSHTRELEHPLALADLDAMNAVQATPWRINGWILDVMGDAWARGLRIAGLEVGEPLSLPARMNEDLWSSLSPAAKKEHILKLKDIHAANASIMGKSRDVLDLLSSATELRDAASIYYPHSKDFRHRIYPTTTRGPNPQGSDISKSLIMFAEGKPLGDTGMFWLCVRAANCFGFDKATLEERVAWTIENTSTILEAATAPLLSSWWVGAAEPWGLLATCHELALAWSQATVTDFVSHLPIPLDGSCNGLQHLAAMGLDPAGALATNLTLSPIRQDIYQQVSDRVNALIARDITLGVPAAIAWPEGSVDRSTVKRAVMTTPYGVTDRGIRDQLIGDGFVTGKETGTAVAAEYLKNKIVEALTGTIASARDIMGWLQEAARRLADAEIPFDWTTPSGSRVRQAYHPETVVRTVTLTAKYNVTVVNPAGGVVTRKQVTGAAPNFIHSFDAAHLTLTVNAALEAGITNFAMIHDSYGTHACDTTTLGVILRRQFVDIYRTDWLQKLKDEIAEYAPHVELDAPPQRGAFDIGEVNGSEYFFS